MKSFLSSRSIAVLLWAAALVFTVVVTTWNVHDFEKQSERNVSIQAEQVADQLANWLSSLITGDRLETSVIRSFVAKAMDGTNVYAVRVVDQYGALQAWQIQGRYSDRDEWDSQLLEGMPRAICPVSDRGRIFGTLEVYIYAEDTLEFVKNVRLRQILYAVLITVFISVCLLVYLLQRGDLHIPANRFLYRHFPAIYHFSSDSRTPEGAEQEDPLEALITQAQTHQIINVEAARSYQNFEPAAVNVTLGLFRHVFGHAPEIMARLLVEERADALIHLASLLEAAAPCIGAEHLRQSAADMRQALESPHVGDLYLAIKRCQFDLENVLHVISR